MECKFFKLEGVEIRKEKGYNVNGLYHFREGFLKSRKDEVLDALRANPNELTAQELADQLGVDRTNVSRYLNELTKDGTVKKSTDDR